MIFNKLSNLLHKSIIYLLAEAMTYISWYIILKGKFVTNRVIF